MKGILEMSERARSYVLLRDAGAGHPTALLRAARGNWNPCREAQPEVSDETLAEVEAELRAEGVLR